MSGMRWENNGPRHGLDGVLDGVFGRYRERNRINLTPSNYTFEDKNHFERMLTNLNSMRMDEMLYDVTFQVGEKLFRAHRLILENMEYFEKILSNTPRTIENQVLTLEDPIDEVALEVLINYAYTGRLNEQEDPKITTGSDVLSRILISELCSSNVYEIRRFAMKQDMPHLLNEVTKFMNHNFTEIFNSKGFLEMSFDEVEEFLSRNELCVNSEREVFDAAAKWIAHDIEERIDSFPKLIEAVRLVLLSRNELEKMLKNYLIKKTPETAGRIEIALSSRTRSIERQIVPRECKDESHEAVKKMENLSVTDETVL